MERLNSYKKEDVLRILRISTRQLGGWEKAGLFPSLETYSFFDLLQIKKLRDLRAKRVRSAVIKESLNAMLKQVAGMENPLLEASTFFTHNRVAFRHQGKTVEPIAGQFVMDFVPQAQVSTVMTRKIRAIRTAQTASELFSRAVTLEDDPDLQGEAVACYRQVVQLDPAHAAAYINLGTLYYNQQNYGDAEDCYRKAVEADPRYALAYFDLGNVLDETGRLDEALLAYKSAILLAPTYADAHYNLALAYEKLKRPRQALPHWQAYCRLDSVGPWAVHARSQARKILSTERLSIVHRNAPG